MVKQISFLVLVCAIVLSPLFCFALDCTQPPEGSLVVSKTDFDGDGILNDRDNCLFTKNQAQEDSNNDSIGDACDSDQDGLPNHCDNCIATFNPDQQDTNLNTIGDSCEAGSLANSNIVKTPTFKQKEAKKSTNLFTAIFASSPKSSHGKSDTKSLKKQFGSNTDNSSFLASKKVRSSAAANTLPETQVDNDFKEFSDDFMAGY